MNAMSTLIQGVSVLLSLLLLWLVVGLPVVEASSSTGTPLNPTIAPVREYQLRPHTRQCTLLVPLTPTLFAD